MLDEPLKVCVPVQVLLADRETPEAGVLDCQVVPLLVSTLPLVLGATKVGADVPLPRMTLLAVSVVRLVPPLATGRVPVTPVVKGKPVKLVATPLVGVPKIGVTNVGLVDNTLLPEPVLVVTPVPPLATGKVPVTPVVNVKPVALVKTKAVGVPRAGVTNVGLVARTLLPVPVFVTLTSFLLALVATALDAVKEAIGTSSMAEVVVCLVRLLWTIGTSSAPVRGVVAAGSAEIFILAIIYS